MSADQTPPENDAMPLSEPAAAPDIPTDTATNGFAPEANAAEVLAAEYLESLQRERAAFQNYKRRVERERGELSRQMSGEILVRLLPILDDFHRAMDAVPADGRSEWFAGVEMILRKLERFLSDTGVSEISALGQPFDPTLHEAIGVDSGTGAEGGTITQVLQRGYQHGERVLRPALVRVAE